MKAKEIQGRICWGFLLASARFDGE